MSPRQSNQPAPYGERSARAYERVWRRYNERSFAAAMGLVDVAPLTVIRRRKGRDPQALDVACGTGIFLRTLLTWIPDLHAVGVDASEAMLAQATVTLADLLAAPKPPVRLLRGQVGAGPTANLPLTPGAFDLITFTNAFHYLPDPSGALVGLGELLAPGGQLIVEDFARRAGPFPWAAFEWLIRRIDRRHVRAYTLAEAQSLAESAGWRVVAARAFAMDWLWRGWALRLARP